MQWKTSYVVAGLLAALGLMVLASTIWPRTVDATRLTTAELVDFVAAEPQWPPLGFAFPSDALRELASRPREDLDRLVRQLPSDVQSSRRVVATHLLGRLLESDEALERRQEWRVSLQRLLEDPDAGVRLQALLHVAQDWRDHQESQLPTAVFAVVREAVGAAEVAPRFAAALAVSSLGPVAAGELPTLLAALTREPDDRVRFMIAVALGATRTQEASGIAALERCLDDAGDNVRTGAMASLGELAPAARATIPRLLAVLGNIKQAADVRHSALGALSRLAETPADAEHALRIGLDLRASYGASSQAEWLVAIGRLARLVPRGASAIAARQWFARGATDGEPEADAAGDELLRLDAARGDPLHAGHLASLKERLVSLVSGLADTPDHSLWYQAHGCLEACVDLAKHAAAGIDRSGVDAALRYFVETGPWFEREWARRLQARLQ